MKISRRRFLGFASLSLCVIATRFANGSNIKAGLATRSDRDIDIIGNFHYVYDNPAYRREFLNFLANVFHLYPQDALHALITSTRQRHDNDQDIYRQLQNNITDIKPFLADLTYALPALIKQKTVMTEQTKAILPKHNFDGYLELGSTGRYLDSLEEVLDISGEFFFISERQDGYSLTDMLDRGQINKAGRWLDLNNYRTEIAGTIAPRSIELATVYIGFHHCPPALRASFIGSIRDTLKPGGSLILRDHDAHNEKMQHMVALAHDVFNMGTMESWAYNDAERRHFYSLAELDSMMKQFGFKANGKRLLQTGDPTRNTLMHFVKI